MNGQIMIILLFYTTIFPFCFLKKIDSLKYTGLMVVVAVFLMLIFCFIYKVTNNNYINKEGCAGPLNGTFNRIPSGHVKYFVFSPDLLDTFAVVSTSYCLQLSVFAIYRELAGENSVSNNDNNDINKADRNISDNRHENAKNKMQISILITTIIAFMIYASAAFIGVYTWYELLLYTENSSMLYCYSLKQPFWGQIFFIVKLLMLIVAAFSYPVVFFSLRLALCKVITMNSKTLTNQKLFIPITIIWSTIMVVIASLPAINLKLVISWGATIAGYPVMFTLPALYFLVSYGWCNNVNKKNLNNTNIYDRPIAYSMLMFGICIQIANIAILAKDTSEGKLV